jgi:multiple sugar transport system permease protein
VSTPSAAAYADLGPRQDGTRFERASLFLMAPALLLLAGLFVAPIVYSLYLGFTNLELIGPRSRTFAFTGLANVSRMLNDEVFFKATTLTIIFVVASAIIGQSVLGMALALLMRRSLAVIRLSVGAIIIVAWVLPTITGAFIWYAFSQAGGTLGVLLGTPSTNFLVSTPMLIVCIANLWRNVAFSMLVFSAGLRNVPGEVLEAAEVEGASTLRRLASVTLPIMRPTIVTNLLLVTLMNLSEFTLIYAMTQGGPGNDTSTLPLYVYLEAFNYNQLGYGTAIALVLVLLGAAFSLLFVRSSRVQL